MSETPSIPQDFEIPPADFSFLVESILMQTQMQLGLLHMEGEPPEGEEAMEPNLPIARHSIDLLAMLQDKTAGNLTAEEHRLLENGLTEVRFRFVQVAEELEKRKETGKQSPLIITPDGGKGSKSS
ncbi:MAG TPA: DUF1844 domain-containing protein [Bryobacteraceae bacterium]|jgi:hypothetical protein